MGLHADQKRQTMCRRFRRRSRQTRLLHEKFEPRHLLSGTLLVQGTGGNDQITICIANSAPYDIEVFVNAPKTSTPTIVSPQSNVSAISIVGGSGNETISVNLAGFQLPSLALSVSGTGQDTLALLNGSYSFGDGALSDATDLSVSLASSTASFQGSQSLIALSLDPSSTATLMASTSSRSIFSVDSIALNGGTLDLTDNDLVVDSTAAQQQSVLSEVEQAVATGYDGGTWTGSGITSSAAAADATKLSALGVILNNTGTDTPIYSSLGGDTLGANEIIVSYTNYGDTNLDGVIDGSDYSRIDNGVNLGLTGWQNGDFNYGGTIDGNDYTLIDNAYNMQGPLRTGPGIEYFDASTTPQVVFGDTDTTPSPAPAGSGASNCIYFQPGHGEIDFSFVGQECDLYIDSSDSNPITIVADGMTSTPTLTPNQFTWIPVETNAVDDGSAEHTITINTAPGQSWELGTDPNESIRLSSQAYTPTIRYAPGFGPSFSLGRDPDFVQIAAGYTVGFQSDGAYGAYNNLYADGAVTFVAETPTIELYTYSDTGCIDLEGNGVNIVQYQITSSGWKTIGTSLDASKPVTYRLLESNNVWGQVNYPQPVDFANLMFPGGTYSAAPMPAPLRVLCVGDSITLGAQDLNTTFFGYPNDIQNMDNDISTTDMGNAGSAVTPGYGTSVGGVNIAQTISSFSIKPDIIVVEWGTNDMAAGVDPTTFESAYSAMLAVMLSSDLTPGGKIYCLGLLPRTDPANPAFSEATSDMYSSAVQQAVESQGSDQVTYTRAYSWLTEPEDYLPDGIHPNIGGYQILADQIEALILSGGT